MGPGQIVSIAVSSTTKTVIVIAVLIGAYVYLTFGTLSPCGILRENVRKHDGMAAILPDGIVDAFLAGTTMTR